MTAAALEWDDCYLVGHLAIDDAHREFAALLDALLGAADDAVVDALDAVARHAVEHFRLENALMERYDFPARGCHADEHDRVLASVHEVQALVAAGDLQVARELAQALAEWFAGHTDYMDSAVAVWVVKKTAGGAPVVLRRRRSTSGTTEAFAGSGPVRAPMQADLHRSTGT